MEDAGTKPCPFLRLYIPQHLLERQSAEQAHLTAFGSSKQCSSEPVVTKLHFTDVGCTPVQLRLKRHQPWHVLWRSFNGVNTTGPTQAQKAATAPRLVLEEDPANNECLALPIAVELPYGAAFPPPSIQVCSVQLAPKCMDAAYWCIHVMCPIEYAALIPGGTLPSCQQ